MNTVGVYLHIPFCASKCGYCAFYSAPPIPRQMERYTEQLKKGLALSPYDYSGADTVYFGGGTPSLLGGEKILDCLCAVDNRYPLTEDCEVTVEANPASLNCKELEELRKGGVNRLSMGVQSLEDDQLKVLGRRHNARQAQEAVLWAQQAGFQNISVDLMLGIPGQKPEDIRHFVETFGELGVTHISAYLLKIEEGTPFAARHMERFCPDEDSAADLYLLAVEELAREGFQQYEISNFAREGHISRHNTRYWKCEDYLGLGPSAHSFMKGQRSYFDSDTEAFLQARDPWTLLQSEGPGGDYEEFCMLGLRLNEGLDLQEVERRYPEEGTARLVRRSQRYIDHGYMKRQGDRLCFTPEGFLVSNDILASLLL